MWQNLQFPADLVTFAEQIHNGKLHFLCSEKLNSGDYIKSNLKYHSWFICHSLKLTLKNESQFTLIERINQSLFYFNSYAY